MDGLIIGIDLCDSYTQISCAGQEESWTFPAVICKNNKIEEWYVGEAAYRHTLEGEGIIVDKLLNLVRRDGTATLTGTKYQGIDLLCHYIQKLLEIPKDRYPGQEIEQIVVTLPQIDAKLMEALLYCVDSVGIPRTSVCVVSHAESFIYYVLSQKKEVWNNQVALFDLSEEYLCYYEMKVQRGLRQTMIFAESEKLEEGFDLNILNTPSGVRLADKLLCSCGERLLEKKLFSSVFLTGKGFRSQDWAGEFMKLICARRRVYAEEAVFAKAAVYKALDCIGDKTSYPFIMICDGRLDTAVSIKVTHKGEESQLVLAAVGDRWYESKSTTEFILDHQNYLEFTVSPTDLKNRRLVRLTLDGFPERMEKTVKIRMNIEFLDEHTMSVTVRDLGFGELFPATDALVRQEVML
ncbi:MAG: DUF5716 family protein [Hungatella sp.]